MGTTPKVIIRLIKLLLLGKQLLTTYYLLLLYMQDVQKTRSFRHTRRVWVSILNYFGILKQYVYIWNFSESLRPSRHFILKVTFFYFFSEFFLKNRSYIVIWCTVFYFSDYIVADIDVTDYILQYSCRYRCYRLHITV